MFQLSTPARHKWEKTRKIGVLRYVLVYGVLFWGGLSGVLFSLMKVLTKPSVAFLSTVTYALPIFMVGGIVFGAFMWRVTEWQYRAANNNAV